MNKTKLHSFKNINDIMRFGPRCPDCDRLLKIDKDDEDRLVCIKSCGYWWVFDN